MNIFSAKGEGVLPNGVNTLRNLDEEYKAGTVVIDTLSFILINEHHATDEEKADQKAFGYPTCELAGKTGSYIQYQGKQYIFRLKVGIEEERLKRPRELMVREKLL